MAKRGKPKGRGMLILGLLVGAAIGAAVGLIFSPATGSENREQAMRYISEKAGV